MKKNRLSFVYIATATLFIFSGHLAFSQSVDTTVVSSAAGFDAATNTVTLPPEPMRCVLISRSIGPVF